MNRTFSCNFGHGVTATVETPSEPPTAADLSRMAVVWSGPVTRKHLRPYIGWMNSVCCQMADEWELRFMRAYMTSERRVEMWAFEPGKPANKVETRTL